MRALKQFVMTLLVVVLAPFAAVFVIGVVAAAIVYASINRNGRI